VFKAAQVPGFNISARGKIPPPTDPAFTAHREGMDVAKEQAPDKIAPLALPRAAPSSVID
jgi:hypothetical protein